MFRKFSMLCWLWLFFGHALAAVPERPYFRIIGSAQGLPSTQLHGLARDRDGYLWIASTDGLARYDGVGMRVWRYDPADAAGLPGNNIQALMIDADDRIWVAVEGAGISVLDAQRRGFSHYRQATHPGITSDEVWAFARQGRTIWFGTYGGGLHRMNADGSIVAYRHAADDIDGLPSDTIVALEVDAAGELWIGTDKGLARLQQGVVRAVNLPGSDGQPLIYSLTNQPDGLWVGTSSGVWRTDAPDRWSQPAWSATFKRPNAMMHIVRDVDGSHWIGSQRGLWRQRGDGPAMPHRTGGPDIPRVVDTMLLQTDGGLWAPVTGLGLGFMRSDWRQLSHYSAAADGLQGGVYRAIAPARGGGFWLAGYKGTVERLAIDGGITAFDEEIQGRLRDRKPAAVTEDHEGRLWLAPRGSLMRIGSKGSIDEWRTDDPHDPTPDAQIDILQVANDGTLWLSAPGGGIQQRDVATGKILLDVPVGEAGALGKADIEALVFSPNGEVWITGGEGVVRLDHVHHRFVTIAELGGGRVYSLAFDGARVLWLQRQSGLEQYRLKNERWEMASRVSTGEGMPAVGAAGIRVDKRHRVWVVTSRGLFRWDPVRKILRRHGGVHDGVSSQEFMDRALAMNDQGVLAAATVDGGLVLVDTTAEDSPVAAPVLRFARFSVRRDGQWRDLPLRDKVQLRREDLEFRLRMRLLAFDDPASSRYWAKLDGFDTDWVALGSEGERVFTGLAPGTYTLTIRAQDAKGNAAQPQSLSFVVPPPWWGTPWARILFATVAICLLLSIGWLYRMRLRRRHDWQLADAKREMAEQASEAKSRFLATLGHEVRTPMTGVLGMSELLLASDLDVRQRGQVGAIQHAGNHLLRLVNDALDLARIEAGRLELLHADFALRPLLDEVVAMMAPLAERHGLQFLDVLDPQVALAFHGDRTRIEQILLNLLGNAIKFTEVGHVSMETRALSPQGLRFIVADSGPGLNSEQQARLFRRFEQADGARTASRYGGSGLGLAISQELAAAMGGRIDVESEPGRGTRFIVDLPLASSALTAIPQPPTPVLTRHSRETFRLLLVEDDATVADVIRQLLQEQGHHVIHAAHGLAALGEVASSTFDAGLLDIDLPGMDGLALARVLRAQGFSAPLIAVTARSDSGAEGLAREAGFDEFLRKPVTGVVLSQALSRLLPGEG